MVETEVQNTNTEVASTNTEVSNEIKFTVGESRNEPIDNGVASNVEQQSAPLENNTDVSDANVTQQENKVISIGFKKEEPAEIFNTLKQKFGRDIDEDYLTKDYKTLFANTEEKLKQFESKSALLDDEVIKSIVDYKAKGGDLKEFFYAQTIDPESIPHEKLIKDFVDRANPEYDDLLKEIELSHKYGIGLDLEDEIAEARENGDANRLYQLVEMKKNRIDAIGKQKEHITSQKVEILNKQPIVQDQQEIQKQYEAKLQQYSEYAQKELSTVRDLRLGDFSLGEQRLDTSHIGFKDDNGILYVQGISDRELNEAIFIYKNKDAIFNKIREDLNVDAEIRTDRAFNNPIQSQIIPTSSSSNGQIKFKIKD